MPGRSRPTRAAHPRSRGENPSSPMTPGAMSGSSPLTRGKLSTSTLPAAGGRLIPAHAGKTDARIWRMLHRNGSSPLTRGKLGCEDRLPGTSRLIPAHAGKTRPIRWPVSGRWAHPRSRGENLPVLSALETMIGSSPLTRGKPFSVDCIDSHARLIPAHAGKTR